MKFFLLRMKVNGIKSIDKEVQLDFYKGTLSKKFDASKSHVKAIYGPNGAGKTALIYAVEIYTNLLTNSDYLAMSNATGALENLVNQKTKKLELEMYFAVIKERQIEEVYRHRIVLGKVNERYQIVEEYLGKLVGVQLNKEDKYNIVFHTKNGKIEKLLKGSEEEKIKNATMNLLQNQSLETIMLSVYRDNEIGFGKEMDFAILMNIIFAFSITVFLQDTDKNYINFSFVRQQLDAINEQRAKLQDNQMIFQALLKADRILQRQTETVPKNQFEQFEKKIGNLSTFLKTFKDDLEGIEIQKDENGDNYEYELILIYKDGKRINKKYESTGIKKIMQLYSALCDVEKGGIVFIDEFDANIHDVLLVKLIEYFMNYAEGQLIFTTHNLGPMDILQKAKHSIDFLSPDSRITSWTSNGNYTAASLYRKGLIEYSPFNIEPFSFIGVFGANQ